MNPPQAQTMTVITAGSSLLLLLLLFIAALLLQQRLRLHRCRLVFLQWQQADRQLLETQIELQEQSLDEIARELHDNVGLSLTLARLQLRMLQEKPGMGNPLVESVADIIGKAVEDLRNISSGLPADTIKAAGLYQAVQQLAEKVQRSGPHAVQVTVSGEIVFLDATKELIIFRMLQEAINNILKHAGADAIAISLFYEPSRLCIVVNDNGCGFNPWQIAGTHLSPGKHSGLRNMQARARALKGNCIIESQPGRGTRVLLYLPI